MMYSTVDTRNEMFRDDRPGEAEHDAEERSVERYAGQRFKSLEVEQQADVRRLMRAQRLSVIAGVINILSRKPK